MLEDAFRYLGEEGLLGTCVAVLFMILLFLFERPARARATVDDYEPFRNLDFERPVDWLIEVSDRWYEWLWKVTEPKPRKRRERWTSTCKVCGTLLIGAIDETCVHCQRRQPGKFGTVWREY